MQRDRLDVESAVHDVAISEPVHQAAPGGDSDASGSKHVPQRRDELRGQHQIADRTGMQNQDVAHAAGV